MSHDDKPHEDDDDGMIDPYLWDRSGPPNAEVERLETLLAPLAHRERLAEPPRAPAEGAADSRRRGSLRLVGLAVGAVLLAAGITLAMRPTIRPAPPAAPMPTLATSEPKLPGPSCGEPVPGSWAFRTEGGPARCGNGEAAHGWMTQDELLETTATSTATLDVAALGTLALEPNTKLRLLGVEGAAQRLELLRGSVHAKISAAPRLFIVKTLTADAVDLGCEYTLRVDEQGSGRLDVSYGAVSLERQARAPTLVTQGTWCPIGAKGPGTPLSQGASDALRRAAEELDRGEPAAFERVVASSTKSDTITLWHVMRRISPEERGRAYDKLASYVPPPRGAQRDAVVQGNREAIAAYREALSPVWFDAK